MNYGAANSFKNKYITVFIINKSFVFAGAFVRGNYGVVVDISTMDHKTVLSIKGKVFMYKIRVLIL